MPIRTLVLALLLCWGNAPGAAAEPAGASPSSSVVLQLPASMSADAVKAMLADLAAKGAKPAPPPPADGARTDPPPRPTSANLAAQVWRSAVQALRAVPLLGEAPRRWVEAVTAGGGTTTAAIRFWVVALTGLAAAPLIGWGVRAVLDLWLTSVTEPAPATRLRAALIRLLIAILGLVAFALALWAVLLCVSAGDRVLEETSDRLVRGALIWRLSIIALIVVFAARRPDLRLLAIDDDDARVCSRWIAVYAAIGPLNLFLVWLVARIGAAQEAVFGAALVFGLLVTGYKIAMIWVIRGAIGRAILAATGGEPGAVRRVVAAGWHWFFIGLSLAVFIAAAIGFSFGKGSSVASAAVATQWTIVALAVLWQVSQKLIDRCFPANPSDISPSLRRQRFRRALHRLCDAFLAILGAAWLAGVWGLDLADPAPGSIERLVARPALLAAVTVVGAWILWTVLSAVIDDKMPVAITPDSEDESAAGSGSRLSTLLPLVRNMLLIGLATIALIVVLCTLGLDVAPLLAGLGVVGIAVGFGAQSLVRDIISGVFFLMEDAFRVGEYVDTGRLRGTVEGMSLRSVRLRHQNGQVHTIPFGQVQAVTNFSRDWAVVKFNLHLEPLVEIETVRRTVKRVGEELLLDPEIGGEFIQPLKMQGVVDVLQNALVVRCKFAATPTRPTYLQRLALRRLIEVFGAEQIRFAAPNVMMQLTSAAVG